MSDNNKPTDDSLDQREITNDGDKSGVSCKRDRSKDRSIDLKEKSSPSRNNKEVEKWHLKSNSGSKKEVEERHLKSNRHQSLQPHPTFQERGPNALSGSAPQFGTTVFGDTRLGSAPSPLGFKRSYPTLIPHRRQSVLMNSELSPFSYSPELQQGPDGPGLCKQPRLFETCSLDSNGSWSPSIRAVQVQPMSPYTQWTQWSRPSPLTSCNMTCGSVLRDWGSSSTAITV